MVLPSLTALARVLDPPASIPRTTSAVWLRLALGDLFSDFYLLATVALPARPGSGWRARCRRVRWLRHGRLRGWRPNIPRAGPLSDRQGRDNAALPPQLDPARRGRRARTTAGPADQRQPTR